MQQLEYWQMYLKNDLQGCKVRPTSEGCADYWSGDVGYLRSTKIWMLVENSADYEILREKLIIYILAQQDSYSEGLSL